MFSGHFTFLVIGTNSNFFLIFNKTINAFKNKATFITVCIILWYEAFSFYMWLLIDIFPHYSVHNNVSTQSNGSQQVRSY